MISSRRKATSQFKEVTLSFEWRMRQFFSIPLFVVLSLGLGKYMFLVECVYSSFENWPRVVQYFNLPRG